MVSFYWGCFFSLLFACNESHMLPMVLLGFFAILSSRCPIQQTFNCIANLYRCRFFITINIFTAFRSDCLSGNNKNNNNNKKRQSYIHNNNKNVFSSKKNHSVFLGRMHNISIEHFFFWYEVFRVALCYFARNKKQHQLDGWARFFLVLTQSNMLHRNTRLIRYKLRCAFFAFSLTWNVNNLIETTATESQWTIYINFHRYSGVFQNISPFRRKFFFEVNTAEKEKMRNQLALFHPHTHTEFDM